MLEDYLVRLRHEASGSLPAAEIDALVAEARQRLEESIQGRLELGMTAEEAEREAILVCSSPASSPRRRNEDTRLFWLIGAYTTLALGGLLLSAGFLWLLDFAKILLIVPLVGYSLACFRFGRPGRLSVWLGTALALAAGVAYVRGLRDQGFGYAFRETFVLDPLRFLGSVDSEFWLQGLARRSIEALYAWRFGLMTFVGVPVAMDLFFGSLGAFVAASRREMIPCDDYP